MKNKPLNIQIWIIFTGILLFFSLLVSLSTFVTLKHFFREETYQMIERAQSLRFRGGMIEENFIDKDQTLQMARTVNHIAFLPNGKVINRSTFPRTVVDQLKNQAFSQRESSKRYMQTIEGERIYYVIRKGTIMGNQAALISYVWDSYLNDLVRTLFKRLLFIFFIIFLLLWFASYRLARYLSSPLKQMEKHVKNISEKNWDEPLKTDREDELGKLAQSIEKMRKKLVEQDEMQQSMLQHISHELKTPVMVIRSYAQSIMDGIFPKKDLSDSVQVIEEEAQRLEKRIKDLIYLTKLDYYATSQINHETFNLSQLLEDIIDRFKAKEPAIVFHIQLAEAVIRGDREQWKTAFENILDNQLRYARKKIIVNVTQQEDGILVQIWNDGPEIEESIIETLFQKFQKGKKGKFGLGLAIVKRTADMHGANVRAVNEDDGVSFYVHFKKQV